jgi:hypothetical protein
VRFLFFKIRNGMSGIFIKDRLDWLFLEQVKLKQLSPLNSFKLIFNEHSLD